MGHWPFFVWKCPKNKQTNIFNIKRTLMSSLLSSREQCLDLANDIGKTCRICGGANHANLLKGTDKKTGTREPINRCITYLCSFLSNTLFIRKQNDWKLQSFCILSFFSNGFHVLPTLFEKMVFCFKPKWKKTNVNETVAYIRLTDIQRVPALRGFWDLKKTAILKICVSWTIEGPLLTQKFPTCAYISQKLR